MDNLGPISTFISQIEGLTPLKPSAIHRLGFKFIKMQISTPKNEQKSTLSPTVISISCSPRLKNHLKQFGIKARILDDDLGEKSGKKEVFFSKFPKFSPFDFRS